MLDESNLLSAEESANIAGVSAETIQQYVSYGLLETIGEGDNARFRESDIRSLFYTRVSKPKVSPKKAKKPSTSEEEVPTLSQILSETTSKTRESEVREQSEQVSEEQDTVDDESLDSDKKEAATAANLDKRDTEFTNSLKAQIELLREERDWLRERVERLETRADREQMLLLSESETVRSLLRTSEIHTKSEPFWKKAFQLPWLDSNKSRR